jgi:hypothetical protein
VLQRYTLAFAPDGAPVFTLQLSDPSIMDSPGLGDRRLLYFVIPAYCSTVEGLIPGCSAGYQVVDAQTLQPRGTILVGQYGNFGSYYTWRSVTGALLRPLRAFFGP